MPLAEKALFAGAVVYALMPLDLIPDLLPFVGQIDAGHVAKKCGFAGPVGAYQPYDAPGGYLQRHIPKRP